MPRGCKICTKCGHQTGPRAFACPQCNEPFMIKGVKMTLETAKIVNADLQSKRGRLGRLRDLFHEVIDDAHEAKVSAKYYDGTLRTFESECGNYRIRWARTYQGIDLKKIGGGRFRLLVKDDDGTWRSAPGKNIFRRYVRAISEYVKRKRNVGKPKRIHPRMLKYTKDCA